MMVKRIILLYFIVITIPLFLGMTARQSTMYTDLDKETKVLEAEQEEWVETNRRLIADIATLTASEKVEDIALNDLGLIKIQPENVLQIWINRR